MPDPDRLRGRSPSGCSAPPPASPRHQVVCLRGPLTVTVAPRLLDSLRALSPAPERVEIDLSGVTCIDRGGATALMDAYVATLLRRGTFTLSGPSAACRQSLRRFGVLDVMDIVATGPPTRQPRSIQ